MELREHFLQSLVALAAEFNARAEPGNLFAYLKVSYSVLQQGDEVRLVILFTPISEEAEVSDAVACATFHGGRLTHICVAGRELPDSALTGAAVDALLAEARALCERSLPQPAPTPGD